MNYPAWIFFFLLFLSPIPAFNQTVQTLNRIKQHSAHSIEAIKEISYPSRSNKTHNFYLNKNWQNSFILSLSGEIIYFNGRYNVLSKTIECLISEEVRVIYPRKIKGAVIGENLFVPLSEGNIQQVDNNRYIEVLSTGKLHLVNSYIMDTRMETGSSISFEGTGKKAYFVDEVLYYTHDFKTFEKLDKSKNKVLELFGTKIETVADFVKEYRLRFNNKEDLVKIFDFYNALPE